MKKIDRTGERTTTRYGKAMVVVGYRNNKDIDVKFEESGNVLEHVRYSKFKNGWLSDVRVKRTKCETKPTEQQESPIVETPENEVEPIAKSTAVMLLIALIIIGTVAGCAIGIGLDYLF